MNENKDKNIIRKGTYQNLLENMDIFQDPLPHKNSCFYSYKKDVLEVFLTEQWDGGI